MYRKYVFYQLGKRPFITLLAILQFALSIFLIGNIVNRLSGYFVTIRLFEGVNSENSYFLSNVIGYEYDGINKIGSERDAFEEELHRQLDSGEITQEEFYAELINSVVSSIEQKQAFYKSLPNIGDSPCVETDISMFASNLYSYDESIKSGVHLGNVMFLTDDCTDALNYQMTGGKWLGKGDGEYIELVAPDDKGYKVGDTLQLAYNVYTAEEGDVMKLGCYGKIVGLIKPDQFLYMGFSSSDGYENGERLYLNDFLTGQYPDSFLAVYNENNRKLLDSELLMNNYFLDPHIVTLKSDLTQQEKTEFFDSASDMGYYAVSMTNAYNNTYKSEMKDLQNDIIFISAACLIALIGLLGVGALFASGDMKTFGIYYINGLTWKECLSVNAVSMAVMMSCSAVLSVVIKLATAYKGYHDMFNFYQSQYQGIGGELKQQLMSRVKFSDFFYYTPTEVITIIVMLILAFAVSMIIPYVTFKLRSPIDVMRSEN